MTLPKRARAVLLLLLLLVATPLRPAAAYSLLTHEQLIDLTWDTSIVPLLLSRYPTLTPAELQQARAYAYGGCVIQDIGYYPFGDAFFSDLTHYVRSGDFVVALFRNARNANELAFAVGALSHYIGDSIGHADATNRAVPIEFPSLEHKYGPVVSYAQGEHQHVQTEFAFDINEIAHHHMAPVHYLRHVGLQVPTRQLADAFYQTYGLAEDFGGRRGLRINVGGYRFATRAFLPRIAYALTVLHGKHEPAELITPDRLELNREIAAIEQENHWAAYRRKPGIGTYSLAGLLFILPKIGPIKLAAIKGPTQATDSEYAHSVLTSQNALRGLLARFTPPPATTPAASNPAASAAPDTASAAPNPSSDRAHPLANRDLDTGDKTKPGGYRLTDETYATLLHRLAANPAQPVPATIKESLQAFYSDPSAPIFTRRKPRAWAQVQTDLATLNTMPVSNDPDPYPTYEQGHP